MAKDYKEVRRSDRDEDRYAKMPKGEMRMLKDGKQAPTVYGIETDSEKYDMDRVRYDSVGTKGYPRQAFEYDY